MQEQFDFIGEFIYYGVFAFLVVCFAKFSQNKFNKNKK